MSDAPHAAAPVTAAPYEPASLGKLMKGENLSFEEMRHALEGIASGLWTPAQIGGFLVALRIKGETAEEIAGAAEAMRALCAKLSRSWAELRPHILDCMTPEGAIA